MRKIIITLIVLAMTSSAAYAGRPSSKNTEKSQQAQKGTMIKAKGQSKKMIAPETIEVKARNTAELKKMSEKKKKKLEEENKGRRGPKKEIYKNQNRVRLAVHNLLAMENMLGGIGPEVSKIAREFNNSVKKTTQAEIKIKERNRFRKFFTGGDKESAEILKKEVSKEEEMIKKLEGLVGKAKVAVEVKANVEEQVKNIKTELERLARVVKGEEESKGVFSR